ncbi:hypothetical protein CEUSTIGMA_g4486.t1 [Chlamydomonas eustigma]|uniref:Helicase-associated domain-containing protein n=1 Tax=Chlamydomonas eustigma TaxID=1157962 RepID=A0A250X276_9CHLO|nr:hypothetical protein CEUSTIGMA_g4486.t1 [Chlamydomonas eustigma]|eukprot:GAX77039.1 hypothetical protein CEUSTIGMA_g4486.t1 [Chlamydomonas eustigma]
MRLNHYSRSSVRGHGPVEFKRCRPEASIFRLLAVQPSHESAVSALLDSFWEARGVFDSQQRAKLVDVALHIHNEPGELSQQVVPLIPDEPLPSVPSTWHLEKHTPSEVLEVSRRLLQLQDLLGGSSSSSKINSSSYSRAAVDSDSRNVGPCNDDHYSLHTAWQGSTGSPGQQGLPANQPHDRRPLNSPNSPSSSQSAQMAVDVIWMVVREPNLLSTNFGEITKRLLEMKIAATGSGISVLKAVEQQPSLLLTDSWRGRIQTLIDEEPVLSSTSNTEAGTGGPASCTLSGAMSSSQGLKYDAEASSMPATSSFISAEAPDSLRSVSRTVSSSTTELLGSSGSSSSHNGNSKVTNKLTAASRFHRPINGLWNAESSAGSLQQQNSTSQMAAAWEFGLLGDGDEEWTERYEQLMLYKAVHGDPHCGFREGDDADLVRWTKKQRSDLKRGHLSETRYQLLINAGFEFEEDEAEFQRWFSQLRAFKLENGHCNPTPLSTGVDLFLIHWCGIQRIALRSRALMSSREEQLTELGFDWSGADPLS